MKIKMGYPNKEQTLELLSGGDTSKLLSQSSQMISTLELLKHKETVKKVIVKKELLDTIYQILKISRDDSQFTPLSNRAGLDLVRISKAWAYLAGRDFVIPDDIFEMAPFVIGHRLVNNAHAQNTEEVKAAKKIIQAL